MIDVMTAFGRALRDLTTPGVLWHAAWPALVSVLSWLILGWMLWPWGMAQMEALIPVLPWSGWEWLSHWAGGFLLLAALGMLTYVTILVLVAVVTLPLLLSRIAVRDYPELSRQGRNVFLRSLGNTALASTIFILGALLSLPLLLIPGAIFIVPLAWTAWLNQRTFRFDALADHATVDELTQLTRRDGGGFFTAAVGCALLAHVPLLNLLAPAITALVFIHYGLARLRALRQQQGLQV